MDYDIKQVILHSPFDIATHREHFKNYLEVIILNDGTVEYAVPSHQEKMIQLGMEITHLDRDSFYNSCPQEYWFDVLTWLSNVTGAIAVWDTHFIGRANYEQVLALTELQQAGLYRGSIENQSIYF